MDKLNALLDIYKEKLNEYEELGEVLEVLEDTIEELGLDIKASPSGPDPDYSAIQLAKAKSKTNKARVEEEEEEEEPDSKVKTAAEKRRKAWTPEKKQAAAERMRKYWKRRKEGR